MHNILVSYNRRYYRRIVLIRLNMYQKLVRVTIAGFFVKVAFHISPELMKQMGIKGIKPHA